MVTAVDPDFDIAAMDFDAYLTKPVHDPEIRAVVEELLALAAYDQRVRDLFSVVEKKAILETEKTEQELAASDEYARLIRREHDLEAALEDGRDDMDDATFRKVFSGLSDPGTERS
jgi:response regulator RpfG family c-di-GMP phosphodiesterase